jgi:hypothetical protein
MIGNLELFNHLRLLDNKTFAYLSKLKEMEQELPDISCGLDYYRMWLSQYNHNKDSITAKSNVELYVAFVCEKRRKFDNTIEELRKEFNKLFDGYGIQILIPMMDFVFDNKNVKNIKNFYNMTQKDILIGLNAVGNVLNSYWG